MMRLVGRVRPSSIVTLFLVALLGLTYLLVRYRRPVGELKPEVKNELEALDNTSHEGDAPQNSPPESMLKNPQNAPYKHPNVSPSLRKEVLQKGLEAVERRKEAVEAQNALGRPIHKRILPKDDNDPLMQLRAKEQKMDALRQLRNRKIQEKGSRQSLDDFDIVQRAVPMGDTGDRNQDPNQRRLLEKNFPGPGDNRAENLRKRLEKITGPVGRDTWLKQTDIRPEIIQNRFQVNPETVPTESRVQLNLGSFDMEAYLSAQRMKKGHGNPMKRFQFNQVASDAIPPDRSLRDVRNPRCVSDLSQYQDNLPTTSVIICFHNEARSALLRTIVSVLLRSPEKLIEEIVLVDDASQNPEDGHLLTAIPKVRLIQLQERQGLIRARVRGAQEARGDVLTFLDSHCEVTPGWLEPLLSRIKTNHTHLVSPVIDIINKDNMQYTTASPTVKGGFGPNLHFKWDSMSPEELRSRRSPIEPIRTPAIAGGLFAIDKSWFEHLGMYDTEMEIWGGENVELSLRVWMCGGSMEIIPCSHVGHIFRSAMPYSFGPGKNYRNTVGKNIRRAVEVWLDEYRAYYYESYPYSMDIPYGDVSDRRSLRERLQCKSFRWYIEHVYPQFEAPPPQDFTYGQLRQGTNCLDSVGRHAMQAPEIRPCQAETAENQGWALSSKGGVKHRSLCLAYDSSRLLLAPCNGEDKQKFELSSSGLLRHTHSELCLQSQSPNPSLVVCDAHDSKQMWEFSLPP